LALRSATWDAVIDTWSGPPRQVDTAAQALVDRVSLYIYVSSRSVYAWPLPPGADESAPVVDADPQSDVDDDYAAAKRGAELAVQRAFGSRSLLARAGLLLGPYEDVGRLPWWLNRLSQGGRVVAPGPPERALQYIDARDLADWLVMSAERGVTGTFNAVGPVGLATISELLHACCAAVGPSAELVWLPPEKLLSAGVKGWVDLPIWVPPTGDLAGLHDGDVSAIMATGLRLRPMRETVEDTWAWLHDEHVPDPDADADNAFGIAPDVERQLLD
jgi:nucleoside-diphosphate-sugar epimerase